MRFVLDGAARRVPVLAQLLRRGGHRAPRSRLSSRRSGRCTSSDRTARAPARRRPSSAAGSTRAAISERSSGSWGSPAIASSTWAITSTATSCGRRRARSGGRAWWSRSSSASSPGSSATSETLAELSRLEELRVRVEDEIAVHRSAPEPARPAARPRATGLAGARPRHRGAKAAEAGARGAPPRAAGGRRDGRGARASARGRPEPYWGLTFKEGNENSRFGEQIEVYACIYTSRVSNLVFYSPMQYFRSPRAVMPHERAAPVRISPWGERARRARRAAIGRRRRRGRRADALERLLDRPAGGT